MLFICLAALETDSDRQRFACIYEAYHARMERTAMRILRSQSDAEDAVQNAFMQVIRHFEKIYSIPREELPFWLISIVRNEALMILRKKRRETPLENWEDVSAAAQDVTDRRGLLELITNLPESYRAVMEMKLLLGYTDREIAARLELSETAVSSRASRARSLLRRIIEKEGLLP